MHFSISKIIGFILRILVSVIILIFLFSRIDIKNFLVVIKKADLKLISVSFLISLFANILCLFRWRTVLRALKLDFNFKVILSSFSLGIFFNSILPSAIGGDIFRAVDFLRFNPHKSMVISSVILDRFLGFWALDVVVIFAVIFGRRLILNKVIFLFVLIFSLLLIFLLIFLFNRFFYLRLNRILSFKKNRFFLFLEELHNSLYYFKDKKNAIFRSFLLSLIIQLSGPLVFFITLLSLGIKDIPLGYFFIFVPILGAVTLLPISIGGLGLREAGTVFLFSQIGLPQDKLLAGSLINSSFLILISIFGGIIYVFTLHPGRLQHH